MVKRSTSVRKHPRIIKKKNGIIRRTSVKKHSRKVYVPPAWKKVKYYKNKPYLATGIDAKGRLQYIQDPVFKKRQSNKKFNRVNRLEKQINPIKSKILRDVDKGNQEARVVYTIYKTGFRPGSDSDTLAERKAYGASTLLKNHVKLKPNNIVKFTFPSKKGGNVDQEIKDSRLSKIIKQQLTSKRLFGTDANKVRKYFSKITKNRFKLKDLRTLKAQNIAKQVSRKKDVTPKIIKEEVSLKLDNTPTVAGQAYINPRLL